MAREKGFTHGALPPARSFLQLKLKRGWRLDAEGACFLDTRGARQTFAGLPGGARVVHQMATEASRRGRTSAAERELARFVHILLPPGVDPTPVLSEVRRWEAVEDARMPPDASLP